MGKAKTKAPAEPERLKGNVVMRRAVLSALVWHYVLNQGRVPPSMHQYRG